MTGRILPQFTDEMTPRDLVAQLIDLPGIVSYGSVYFEQKSDSHGAPIAYVDIVTGGWSDNEQLVSELSETSFHSLWWQSSHRGGLHTYEVPIHLWTARGWLIDFANLTALEGDDK